MLHYLHLYLSIIAPFLQGRGQKDLSIVLITLPTAYSLHHKGWTLPGTQTFSEKEHVLCDFR
jgi:hypothetical protein